MNASGGGQKPVHDRKGIGHVKATPLLRHFFRNRQNAVLEVASEAGQPGVIAGGLPRVLPSQALYALADLAHHEDAQEDLSGLGGPKPFLDQDTAPHLVELGQYVGVDQEAQSLIRRARWRSRFIRRRPKSGPFSRNSLKSDPASRRR